MKAVMLAAGKSTRTYPLTLTRPKPLLKVANKPLLQHNLEQLQGIVDEVVLIVGYRKEMIMEYFGDKFGDIKINYVEQKEQLGTAHALLTAEGHVSGKFIVLNGDDLYHKNDIKQCLKHDYALLGKEVKDISSFGICIMQDNRLKELIEKPKDAPSNIANAGLYVFDDSVFAVLKKLKKSPRGEYEVVDAINQFAKEKEMVVERVKEYWFPIGYPWDLLTANQFMLDQLKGQKILGEVEKNVVIKGAVFIGKGTVVKSGSYIEGPCIIGENCEIGPFAHFRPHVSIDDNARIGKTELVDCIIMKKATAKHYGYLGHSVIGENANIGAGTVTADYRHDGKNHITLVNGKKVDSGRRKLGAFLGDDVRTGINTSIYPGRKIWPGLGTLPGEIVLKDKMGE
jgi:UDP-N-acetylglucosamine diphosphorylase/glucosamine-1-phosphate N-acetyltransferase